MLVRWLSLVLIFFSLSLTAQDFETRWDTSLPGVSLDTEITIPTNPAFTYNYAVDWGDGNSDTNVTGDITHTYASAGIYTVRISGTFPAIYFNDGGDREKILEIVNWGNLTWQSFENAFYGCTNLNFDAIAAPDLTQVISLKNMFREAVAMNGILNHWNVSTIADISGMFADAEIFNRPLDNWNTISVTDMSETFSGAHLFNEPLDNWNTASVTTTKNMFRAANNFNQIIGNWDVSQVTDMSGMFAYANRFNRPLNTWNVANVTLMVDMFAGADFDQPLNNWDVAAVTDMSGMFSQYCDFNQNINNWNVSNVTDMSDMFLRATYFNQPLDQWDVSSVTDMSGMFDGFYATMVFNQPLNTWNVSNVTDMANMFRDTRDFDQPLNNWDVSQVTNMNRMFERADAFNQDISGWNVGNVTSMASMFQETETFNINLNAWNVSQVTNMSYVFYRSESFNQPLDLWNVSAVTNFQRSFAQSVFDQDISGWDVSAASNMNGMFLSASVFNRNLAPWNIANVSNMTDIFSNSGLSQENYDNVLIGWATQSVRDNINFGATALKYCDGMAARQELIDDHSWNFTGDIPNCSFVLCTQVTAPLDGDTNVPANSDIRWAPAPNATGYRISIRRENGATTQVIYDNEDVGNVVKVIFTNEFIPGDTVYVTVVPYNAEGPATGCTEMSFTVVDSWVNSPDAFKLTYDTSVTSSSTTNANQLKIEANTGYPNYLSYNYSIDWGDGEYNNNVTGDITHTYLNPGVYTVSIIGDYPAPYHDYSNTDAIKLQTIDQWGTQQWQSMERAFYGCRNMTYNATDVPDLSQVTHMTSMFSGCREFNGDINNWDVSNVTHMISTFVGASEFDQPLNNWDVSNVTHMSSMFYSASKFNQPLNSWNMSNVTTIRSMFEQAKAFNQPLDGWDVSSVTDMSEAFERAESFNQPLNSWDVSNVTDMHGMFNGFVYDMAFNQPLDNWDVSQVTNMSEMFERCVDFNQPLNTWNVSNVTDMSDMFTSARSFDQPLNNWNVGQVTDMSAMFSSARSFNQDISNWNVTHVTNMRYMFSYAVAFNSPLNTWDVNSVVNMTAMFRNAESFNQPLANWDVSAVANMTSMFEEAELFNQPINTWDVSSVTLMESMFEEALAFDQELNNWNVASVTDFEAMFKGAESFNGSLGNWDTGEAQNMFEMFYGATVFDQNLNAWDVSFVTTLGGMFQNATTYNQSMDAWNVASVTTMERMFQGATSFNSAIGSWNVRRVENMSAMFSGATAFDQNLNNWRVFNVANMDYMFRNASAYNQNMEQWDIRTTSMRSMFDNATAFDQDLGDWNMAQVTQVQEMLDNAGLSRTNYDNTLIAWSEQTLTPGLQFGAATLPYCDALEERQAIIDTYGWIITGDVLDCPLPACTQLTSPLNGAIDVPENTNLSWDSALFARGYRLTVRTMPGNVVVVNNEAVTETTYSFTNDFNAGDTVFVSLVPYNDTGDAVGCVEESFTITNTIIAPVPDCTVLTLPVDGATEVEVTTDISWAPVANADGYRISVGTTSGGNEVLSNVDLGNVTTYDLTTDLPEDTQIFVTLTPYNAEGDATACTEASFTTELIPVPPACTTLSNPLNGTTNVPVDTGLAWNAVADATGYLVVVGTTQGGNEVVNQVDVGNATTFSFPDDLRTNRTYYVSIIPYNNIGDALACTEESFRTGAGTLNDPPACTALVSPLNGATDIAVSTDLSWTAAANTDGYRLTLGTSSGGNDLLDNLDVGNVTTYDLATDLPENTTVYLTIVPYNANGPATTCTEESFTTETVATVPACTQLTAPLSGATDVAIDTDLSWTASPTATGYKINMGTTSGATDILNVANVGNITTYDLAADLDGSTTYFVTIVPYNAEGDALGCTEESFTTETVATVPACTQLTAPLSGATDVAVDIDLSWTVSPTATGYKINMGTTSGATDILNAANVGNITTYDLAAELDGSTTYFVTIVPYNAEGDALGCTEESFTTETVATLPTCTQLTDPTNNATGVFVDSDISWAASATATGYRIRMGTTSGGNDILDQLDVGNVTTYDLPNDLPGLSPIFVTITPYNAVGDAVGCTEERFDTNVAPSPPACSNLLVPAPNAVGVALDTDISWIPLGEATGYRLTVATSSGGNDIVDNVDVGANITYDLPDDLPENTTIYVSVVPYNALGDASGCSENSFTTLNGAAPPNCTAMTSPLNGAINVPLDANIEWAAIPEALGYRITVGSVNGGGEITLNEDVGNVTSYSFGPGWVESVTYYVTIVPYNTAGDALGCAEESFVTVPPQTIPDCPLMVYPSQGDTAVPIDTAFSWQEVTQADGYRISLGNVSGQYNLLNAMDVGAVTTYQWSQPLPEGQDLYLLVEAYNTAGTSAFCDEVRFTTLSIPNPPPCSALVHPATGDTEVAVDTVLEWEAIDTATGYHLGVGTSPGGDDLLPLVDVGLLTSYQLATDLPFESEIFVTIIPYNEDGDATGCDEQSFTTIEEPEVETQYGFSPDGDGINEFWEIKGIEQYPNNVVTIYNRWGDAVFKISGYDNVSQVFRGQANQLTNRGGGTLPEGTYFFQIDIPESHNLKATQGFLVLKR
ncbi:BspA family leucine-rich repeat surface protein [Sediminicola luteus]|uniref:PKD domain-containing protein n=1 Tax=Sediminicola luteus TaxID=319238 RepID=A0A2A4GDJ1_9FLAO|nr:BspA family leucine-rich repeat surface protein [Sediminicola luteus]PCE66046.1 hypothetical protein B7P33_01730 [Sediminicola luteus]